MIMYQIPFRLVRCFALLLLLVFMSSNSFSQLKKTEHTLAAAPSNPRDSLASNKLELTKLDWLVGRWVGTGLGGECEEVFLPPWNDSMIGSFRFASEGKVVFSEFFSLVRTENGMVLRLKHFHPDMKSWEEKDETTDFELIRVDENAVWFDGLTYKLVDENQLNVWVAMKNSATGELSEASFVFHRSTLANENSDAVDTSIQSQSSSTERILRKEIEVDCSKETAFEMWTTSAGVAKFFSPDSLIEPFPGGAYEMYFGLEPDENGRRGSQGSKVVSMLPNAFLIFDWTFPPTTPELRRTDAKTHVKVEFDALGKQRCRVRLTQYGWKTGEEWDKGYAYFERVWPAVLKQFQTACAQ
jgi:uncharacterized protein YndB with AHSA1/START domain